MPKSWKQLECPSTLEWVNKLWYIHTMDFYTAVEIPGHAPLLECGSSQTQQKAYNMLSTQHSCYRVLSTPFFRHRNFKTSVQGLPTNNRAQSWNSSPDFRRLENCASSMTCTVWCHWRRTRMHEFQNCQLESSHSTGDGVCIHCENRRTQLELTILIHPPVYLDAEEPWA